MAKKTTCVFIATNPGQTISVIYKDTEPVAHLLDRVRSLLHNEGSITGSAKLFINAIEIDNYEYTVDYYRVFGNVFTVLAVNEKQRPVQVYIRTVNNKIVKRVVMPERTIRHLKVLLPPENWKHRITYLGRTLEGKCRIKDYDIDSLSSLSVTPKLVGGSSVSITPATVPLKSGMGTGFVDVSLAAFRTIPLVYGPQFWLAVKTGINVCATCACKKSSEVVCPLGVSTFKLGVTELRCPACKRTDVKPHTVGFYRCWFRSHGLKADGMQHSSDWRKIAEEDGYWEFVTAKQAEWLSLAFEVRELGTKVMVEDCTICLDPLFEDVDKLKCGHKFHKDCLAKWMLGCPLCRSSRL